MVRGQRRKGSFYQSRDANRASEPCVAEVAAHRPRFVCAARRAPSEDCSLRSTVCRHQDSRESSDEHELAPCRVRARRPPHASGPLGAGRWRGHPDAARREFVLSGRFPAVPMPTNNAPQGPILAWRAARRPDQQRPPRGLDRAPDRALARSRPRSGRGSFLRRAAHQARIGPCVALFVGISTAGNRPMSTNWRHAAAGRAGLHTPPDPLGARRWDHAPGQYGASSSSSYEPWLS